ncbi:MAG TPA: single-stranded DNA-binding protein [Kouleothrix sp.]|uniref:single-stranded DNA-binding protein n=1 Tax=Kouleothrix sp. TaxID=2779161 RepID=UPI002BCAE48F|nr:single-stranded DNA-binding protein [Kouleothrix sp.]HRC75233.1 single-stranded DNA-binding protein [Kouleothrix sp.]
MEQIKGTLNRVELIGWLGAEPEQRFVPSGAAVCNFRVATKRPAGRNEAGERILESEWTNVEAWEKLAEQCGRYLHKGSRVRVVGSLHTQSWEDRETGQRRFKTVVRAEDVLFLDTRSEAQEPSAPAAEEVEDLPF